MEPNTTETKGRQKQWIKISMRKLAHWSWDVFFYQAHSWTSRVREWRLLSPSARFFVLSLTEMDRWFLLWTLFVHFSSSKDKGLCISFLRANICERAKNFKKLTLSIPFIRKTHAYTMESELQEKLVLR